MTPNLWPGRINPPLCMPTRLASPAAIMLAQYEKIVEITGCMMAAAREDKWNEVIDLGQQYGHAVETLPHYDASAIVLTDQERAAKRDLLIRILEHDAMTRELISPQLVWLSALLGRLKRQRSLLHAYGSDEAHLL